MTKQKLIAHEQQSTQDGYYDIKEYEFEVNLSGTPNSVQPLTTSSTKQSNNNPVTTETKLWIRFAKDINGNWKKIVSKRIIRFYANSIRNYLSKEDERARQSIKEKKDPFKPAEKLLTETMREKEKEQKEKMEELKERLDLQEIKDRTINETGYPDRPLYINGKQYNPEEWLELEALNRSERNKTNAEAEANLRAMLANPIIRETLQNINRAANRRRLPQIPHRSRPNTPDSLDGPIPIIHEPTTGISEYLRRHTIRQGTPSLLASEHGSEHDRHRDFEDQRDVFDWLQPIVQQQLHPNDENGNGIRGSALKRKQAKMLIQELIKKL